MRLIDSITIKYKDEEKYIKLYEGDLTSIPEDEAVDLLILSAYPNDYTPTFTSLIGKLYMKGLAVADLALDKEVDLRSIFSCWLSKEIKSHIPGLNFKRILCYEPYHRGTPPELVSDIFQSLMPFIYSDPPIYSIAMPILATGDQDLLVEDMFLPLFDAAFKWLSHGIPIQTIKFVEISNYKLFHLKNMFAELKKKYSAHTSEIVKNYDYFISYSTKNAFEVDHFVNQIKMLKPDSKIFQDKLTLQPGSSWQEEIYVSIEKCKNVLVFYSPAYLESKICKEEFNIALFRHRENNGDVLFPIYLYSAELPIYMQMIQYVDCREGDLEKINDVIKKYFN